MADSDSDEDTFVTIGTPLPPLEEGVAARKPVTLQDQTVTDERGRRRFHGAFTGGFSAGYFNSVGSKEGWKPQTFVSSRSKKADNFSHNAEDYMDESDKGEFGIAPRKITTSADFHSGHRDFERKRKFAAANSTGAIPGLEGIIQDIVPTGSSMGMRLLQKLGWRSGQGIGPRSRRKQKTRTPTSSKSAEGSTTRVFGCAMKPESDSDDSSDASPQDFNFAPKDMNPISFDPKDNVYGIGYRGIDPATALTSASSGHVSLFEPPTVSRNRKKGITGHAFGVGAFEDDDDDIYATDSMSKYDTVLRDESTKSRFHGWTAPGSRQAVTHASYIGQLLEGFTLSEKPLPPKKIYPPPKLPRDYKPIHKFQKPTDATDTETSKNKTRDAATRREIIGEKVEIGSVFDLISSQDKQKINLLKPSPTTSRAEPTVKAAEKPGTTERRATLTNSGFKPFAKEAEKQKRYDDYLEAAKHGQKYNFDEALSGMTELEKEREREEFIRAAQLYRPMSGMMASRFTSAKHADSEDKVELAAEQGGDKNDQAKAAELKMFGRLTHDEFEWHPSPVLCKRFNIPNPYPGSSIVGLRTARKDKLSMYNFLSFPDNSDTVTEEESKPTETKAIEYTSLNKSGLTTLKKVNIFSKIDELQKPAVAEAENAPDEPMDVEGEKTDAPKSESDVQKQQVEGLDRPPMDLFKAIFQDSDDSSSSSDENDDQPETRNDQKLAHVELEVGQPARKIPKIENAPPDSSPVVADSPGESSAGRAIPGTPPSLSDDEDIYGPSLPPTSNVTEELPSEEISRHYTSKHIFVEKTKDNYISASTTKEKPKKHKDKHKQKKEKKKKSKYKHKPKHKSSKKKKKKQSSKNRDESSESSYEGSSEDSGGEDGSAVGERDLLDKIKSINPGKRLTAADFM